MSGTLPAAFTVDNRAANQIEEIEIDLCRFFAQAILRPDGSANFLFGTEVAPTDGRIPLVPGREVPDQLSVGMVAAVRQGSHSAGWQRGTHDVAQEEPAAQHPW